jgi:hypothetical protein
MSERSEKRSGGFDFGSVGGDANLSAGGDLVGGDKITTTTTTITVEKGFAGDEQKQQFQATIDQLREALLAIKAEIEASASLDLKKKDEVVADMVRQVRGLEEVKEEIADIPTGKPAPPEIATKVENVLNHAGGITGKLQGLAAKGSELGDSLSKFALKWGPLLISAGDLFVSS